MVDVVATVDPASVARLNATIARLHTETGRSVDQAVTFAAIRVAESIRARAKPSKANRDIIDNPEWKQAQGSFAWARAQLKAGKAIPAEAQDALTQANAITPDLIIVKRQEPKPDERLGAYEKTDPRRVIERRGLAKSVSASIVASMARLKTSRADGATGTVLNTRNATVRKSLWKHGPDAGSIAIRMINRLSYMEKAYPGITAQAVQAGAAKLQNDLKLAADKAAARANAA